MRRMLCVAGLWMAAGVVQAQTPCGSSFVPAQSTGLSPFAANRLVFPNSLPFTALDVVSAANPFGYPNNPQNHWPALAVVGDIDNDGELDLLYQIEQRLLVAVKFTRSSCGLPIVAVPLWAIFQPQGAVNKNTWGADRPVIFDIDGDGSNEVVWVGRHGADELVVQVIDDNATLTNDPAFGGVPRPTIAATWSISANDPGWANRILNGARQNVVVSVGRFGAPNGAFDLLVTSSQSAEPHVLRFDPGSPQLTLVYSHPWAGQNTHYPHVFDLDGDGVDEILANGVLDPNGADWRLCSYYSSPDPWTCPSNATPYDHADDVLPIGDLNGDGVQDLVLVDDRFTKIASGAASGPSVPIFGMPGISVSWSQLLHHNTSAPVGHGQGLAVGRFLPGLDTFNVDGPQILMTPKGAPIFNGQNTWGSFVANKHLDSLALGITSPPWNGSLVAPTGWRPHAIDWDGDRSSDEVFNPLSEINAVFRMVAAPSGSPYPYQWRREVEVALWGLPEGGFNTFASLACDMFGDPREELLCFSRRSIVFLHNPTPHPFPGRYKTPWESIEYRRRFNSTIRRTVDYQSLPELERVEIRPATLAVAPGGTATLTAVGHYSDGSSEDVTAFATWSSGNTAAATLSGATLNGVAAGTAAVQATVAGIPSRSPCVAVVTTSSTPRIVYAGWVDTHLTAGQPGTLTVEAAVADLQSDVLAVGLFSGGSTISLGFVDDGTQGDRVAGDNIWTLRLSGVNLPQPSDAYFEVVAADTQLSLSERWPYVAVPGGTATPVPGVPLMPFASESFGTPLVRIAGLGVLESNLTGGGGTLTLGARVDDPRLQTIFLFFAGADLGQNLNDSGLFGDQIAGDGLWSRTLTLPPGSLPGGEHVFDMLGFSTLPGGGPVSDAHPRLRAH